ncbi:C-signal [Neocloeon triangulifer]|uniref:C-signal n=1 Tax=Neocloeon triangulifer TaxID=2078957 RepID=UPI00286F8DF6|nr:C-signal [Neocloeon triangulifer]
MKTVLITGCNRGLGLEFVRQLVGLKNPPSKIIATCRSIDKAQELNALKSQNQNIHILELDVTNFDKYNEISEQAKDIVGDDGLNVLINNAGVTTKFTRLNMVKQEQIIENLIINAVAPIMFTKALLPLLKTAAANNASAPLGSSRAVIMNMSSILGSIEMNKKEGGFYPYRTSKSALNAATKSMSIDLKSDGILTISMHPGWVQTDMGGKQAPLKPEQSIKGMLGVLADLKVEQNGLFLQFDGKKLPW